MDSSEDLEFIGHQPPKRIIDTFEAMRATSILVAILKHNGKLGVPRYILDELLTQEQVFPNDFITKNGSMARVTYEKEKDMFFFELGYMDEKPYPNHLIGFQCTRSDTRVGDISYDDPYYRN